MKLVKGEGRATRARALARLASPRRAGPGRGRGRGRGHVVYRDRDRDREAYALFLSFMSVIHVSHNPLY